MGHKQIHFKSEARQKFLKGAAAIAEAVRVTLGPKSKSVLIEKKWGKALVCNDGVTIGLDRGAACGSGTTTKHLSPGKQSQRKSAGATISARNDTTIGGLVADAVGNLRKAFHPSSIPRHLLRGVERENRVWRFSCPPGSSAESSSFTLWPYIPFLVTSLGTYAR